MRNPSARAPFQDAPFRAARGVFGDRGRGPSEGAPPGRAIAGSRERRAPFWCPWLAAAAAFAWLAAPAHCESPTLYERIASGALVVHGRCHLGGRRAVMDVLEVFKGSYVAPRLQVSYRSENFNRTPGSPRIDFQVGAESILVLEPEKDEGDRSRGPDRFVLVGAALGKIDLPAEGGAALLEALRRLTAIQSLQDQKELWAAQKNLIRETNPILIAAGFDEILKFRLGDEGLVASLVGHLGGPRPEFRRQTLRVIGQMFARQRRTGERVPSGDLLTQETLSRANGDEAPEIRAEAVRALRELQRPTLTEALKHLAASDPSQVVRYEAELALLDLKQQR